VYNTRNDPDTWCKATSTSLQKFTDNLRDLWI